jgi:penicillin-binding protein 1A
MANKNLEARNRTIIKWMWRGLALFFAAVLVVFFLIYNGIIGYMPPVAELRNPTDNFASTMYTADGVEMGKIFQSRGNRYYVEFDQISNFLKDALIATEDERYNEHSGIDATAIGRSIIKRIILGQKEAGGGSTITQQLAKQLYTPTSRNIFERAMQKPIEWVIAMKLERYFTKDEIMQMYFNQFDFLNNAVGIKSASYVYFGKNSPSELNVQEAALLVGMCKNPAFYNPLRYPERAKERRNLVLRKMAEAGFLTQEDCQKAQATELLLAYHKVSHNEGFAPYVREEVKRMMMAKRPIYTDYPAWNKQAFYDDSTQWVDNPLYGWCNKNHKSDGRPYNIYTDGLKIYTTIDSKMQRHAEDAMREHMMSLQRIFWSEKGISSGETGNKDPYTTSRKELPLAVKDRLIKNAIHNSPRYKTLKARGMTEAEIMNNFNTKQRLMVFDIINGEREMMITPLDSLLFAKSNLRCGVMSMDSRTGYVKAYVGGPDFDHFSYDMVSVGRRQIGSTMKPYLYSLAMECGYNPCDRISNARININGWSPRGGGGGGMLTLKQALTTSNNTCSARLVDLLKVTNLITMLHNYGLTNDFDTVAPLCLGPCEISVKQQVSAYSVFSNKGIRSDPIFVSRICDSHGNVIAEFTPRQKEVLSEDSYLKMLTMLESVINAGTGRRCRSYVGNIEMGGKTGTTNLNSDGWFMGFTPELVTGVWVGGEERYIRFYNGGIGQGAGQALPIWGRYMKAVLEDSSLPYKSSASFNVPANYDFCARERGLTIARDDMWNSMGSGRRSGGGAASGGGAVSTQPSREEPHQAEAMQGVFD